jgi:hypothetical protein
MAEFGHNTQQEKPPKQGQQLNEKCNGPGVRRFNRHRGRTCTPNDTRPNVRIPTAILQKYKQTSENTPGKTTTTFPVPVSTTKTIPAEATSTKDDIYATSIIRLVTVMQQRQQEVVRRPIRK